MPSRKLIGSVAAMLVAALGLYFTFSHRSTSAEPSALPTVAVVKVEHANLSHAVSLTAEMRPWQEIDIHAKVAGYLKTINVDIGDHVKEGQVIATLDLPEQQQDQVKAEADYNVARLDYERIQAVIKKQPGLLAQEEVDKSRGAYEEAKAAYQRTKILAGYAVIAAPFDGVVTKRSADPGALVQAGTSSDTQTMPLVHLAEIGKLRLDFPAPESIVAEVKTGMPVDVEIQATGEVIHTSVMRMSDKVDPSTRTMDVEVDLDNADQHLKPGMYATAKLALETKQDALAAPVQAISGGAKPNVWVVNRKDIVEEHPVTLGIQMPDKDEILSGVSAGDRLVYGNRGEIGVGTKVAPKLISISGS